MKATVVILATLFIFAVTTPAHAQDWVMDWTSTGHDLFRNWSIGATSSASLTPATSIGAGPAALPPFFNTPVYVLGFSYQGQSFGGFIAQGQFQTPDFAAPVPLNATGVATPGRFHEDFNSGTFTLSGDTFSLDLDMGGGHLFDHFVASGHLAPSTTAAEPTVLLFGGVGLVGAAVLRRWRRS